MFHISSLWEHGPHNTRTLENEMCSFLMVTIVSLFSNSQQPDSSLLNLTRINPHPGNPGNVNGSFLCEELDKPLSSTLDAPFSSFTLL